MIAAALLGSLPLAVQDAASEPHHRVPFELAGARVLSRPEGDRLCLLGTKGELSTLGADFAQPRIERVLETPARSLLALAPAGNGGQVLFVLSPAGCELIAPTEDGGLAEPRSVEPRARFDLLVGEPRFAPFATDIDGDGRTDVVVPDITRAGLWLQTAAGPEETAPAFRSVGRVRLATRALHDSTAEQLSDELSATIEIPALETDDLQGDGLPDLLVESGGERHFFLQRPGGGFADEAYVVLDAGAFRDPEAGDSGVYRPGASLSLRDAAAVVRADLTADGRPDFVLSHGKKLWVFPATEEGPQFTEPSTVLRSAEQITAAVVARIDDDARPDLVLLRLIMPSLPTLVLGMVRSFDVELSVSAYHNAGNGRFDPKPVQSRELELRVPPILDILRDPYSILERLLSAGEGFHSAASGDLDGEGGQDLVLYRAGQPTIEIYSGRSAAAGEFGREDFERALRRTLFEDERTTFDVDRLARLVGTAAAEQVQRWTAGQPADVTLELDAPDGFELSEVFALDPGGDGRAELVALWRGAVSAGRARVQRLDGW